MSVLTLLGAFDGARISGGCDSCDAYQTVEPAGVEAAIWRMTVYHDPECPFLNKPASQRRDRP